MLWVTIIAVSWLPSTMRAVSCSTKAAVLGSSAAVCSSSSRMREGCRLAISRLTAWRWPPESRPMRSARRFSSPSCSMLSLSRNSSRSGRFNAMPKPRWAPRRQARAMFSSMVRASQVPAIGSWKTRATRSERCQAERRVTSAASMWIVPRSTIRSPLTAFRKVDLPAPLEPMTVTNWPVGMVRSSPRSTRFSIGVPGLKVSSRPWARNITGPP